MKKVDVGAPRGGLILNSMGRGSSRSEYVLLMGTLLSILDTIFQLMTVNLEIPHGTLGPSVVVLLI